MLSRIQGTSSVALATQAHDWKQSLAAHWRHRQLLKVLGICLFLWLFFIGYFHVLRHPVAPVTVMPLTALDRWIGVEPAAFWVYVSLWFYVGIAPCLLPSLRALAGFGGWAALMCGAGLLCFYLWPTAVPWPPGEIETLAGDHAGFALLRGVDAAGNACPSLHVATAMFTACWLYRLLARAHSPGWVQAVNIVWFAAIAWSTVAVRQHVVLDVVAGAALGAVFAALSLRLGPNPGEAGMGQPVSSVRH